MLLEPISVWRREGNQTYTKVIGTVRRKPMCTGIDQLKGSDADSLHQSHQEDDLTDLLSHVSQVVFTDLFPVFDFRG